MSTATNIGIQAAADGSTFYNIHHPTIQSATVATPQVFISQAVGANGGVCQVPLAGLGKIRFLCTAVVSGGVAIKVICSE
jgi:hypothetical protein